MGYWWVVFVLEVVAVSLALWRQRSMARRKRTMAQPTAQGMVNTTGGGYRAENRPIHMTKFPFWYPSGSLPDTTMFKQGDALAVRVVTDHSLRGKGEEPDLTATVTAYGTVGTGPRHAEVRIGLP